MITRNDRGRLVFKCDACGEKVTGRGGYVHVDLMAVERAERAEKDWKQRNPGPGFKLEAFMTHPEPVRWQVHHRACDPNPESWDYHFEIYRTDTLAKLAHWTAHLMAKGWLQHTNWGDVLFTIGDAA